MEPVTARTVAFTCDEIANCAPARRTGSSAMGRRRFNQETPLQDRLAMFAQEMREKAEQLKPGPERDDLLRRARRADTSMHLDDWAKSPGLQPPK